MSKITALRMTAFCALTAAAAVTASIGPFDVPQRRLLPVEAFPQQIGRWQAVSEHPVEQTVQDKLPTAKIVDRIYQDSKSGNQVDVMLLTATAVEDIHKPTSCLPAQGWQLDSPEHRTIGGQSVTILKAENDASQRIEVGYWLTGYYPPRSSHGPLIDGLLDVRNRLVGRDKAMSLFVRVIADQTGDNTALTDFVKDALPSVQRLTATSDASEVATKQQGTHSNVSTNI